MKSNPSHPSDGPKADETSALVFFIRVLGSWWRFIFLCVVIATILTGIVAFILPVQFKSTTTVFPSEKADLFGALEGVTSLARSLSPRGLASLGGNPDLDRYMAILKSGRVLSNVIEKFDLVNVYGITSYPAERTAKRLLENVEFTVDPEGSLTVAVFDTDPQRASDMANFFVDELNRANTELQVQSARGNRAFIEERYRKNLADLSAAEDSLRMFQKRYGVVSMPEQTEASIKAGAELVAQMTVKEVQLAVLKRYRAPDDPAVLGAQVEIDEFRHKLAQMNRGTVNDSRTSGEMNIFVPFASIPDLGSEYLRRYREIEIQYKILQFLTPLYEQAKVEEKRQTPSVVVLDRASPAERKSRPKRMLIVLGGMIVGLLGSLGTVAVSERWRREREENSQLYQSAVQLVSVVRADILSLVRRSRK